MSSPAATSSTIWAEMLKDLAHKEVRRINRSSEDSQLRRIIQRQASNRKSFISTPKKPLISWTAKDDADFDRWIHAEPPRPVPFELASGLEQWTPGDPIILTTGDRKHFGWIRPKGGNIRSRWLGFNVETHRINLDEICLRDPRRAWAHPYLMQVGVALLLGERDPHYAWLLPEPSTVESPKWVELWRLLFEAKQELWW